MKRIGRRGLRGVTREKEQQTRTDSSHAINTFSMFDEPCTDIEINDEENEKLIRLHGQSNDYKSLA